MVSKERVVIEVTVYNVDRATRTSIVQIGKFELLFKQQNCEKLTQREKMGAKHKCRIIICHHRNYINESTPYPISIFLLRKMSMPLLVFLTHW